jgi:hypothetical protein
VSRTPDVDRAELDKQDLTLDPEGLLDCPEELETPSEKDLLPAGRPTHRDPFSLGLEGDEGFSVATENPPPLNEL